MGTLTIDVRAQVIDLLRRGTSINEVCNQTGLLPAEVQQIANDARKTAATREPLTGKPLEHQVLEGLAKHPSKKVASRATGLLAALTEWDEKYAERAAAKAHKEQLLAEKAKLEQKLAAVRAELRGGDAPKQRATAARSKEQWAEIRAWCNANGHPVSKYGAVPRTAVEAYDAAHPGVAA